MGYWRAWCGARAEVGVSHSGLFAANRRERPQQADPRPPGPRIHRRGPQGTTGTPHRIEQHVARRQAALRLGPDTVDQRLAGHVHRLQAQVEDDHPKQQGPQRRLDKGNRQPGQQHHRQRQAAAPSALAAPARPNRPIPVCESDSGGALNGNTNGVHSTVPAAKISIASTARSRRIFSSRNNFPLGTTRTVRRSACHSPAVAWSPHGGAIPARAPLP